MHCAFSRRPGSAADGYTHRSTLLFLTPPLHQLNHAIHSSLIIREQVPAQYAYARVEEGMLHLVDADNFALSLMMESPEPASALWRLLDIQLLFPPQVTLADFFYPQILPVSPTVLVSYAFETFFSPIFLFYL